MTPTPHDLLDMSIWSLREHVRELQDKWSSMTPQQRAEFREIAMSILTEKREAA